MGIRIEGGGAPSIPLTAPRADTAQAPAASPSTEAAPSARDVRFQDVMEQARRSPVALDSPRVTPHLPWLAEGRQTTLEHDSPRGGPNRGVHVEASVKLSRVQPETDLRSSVTLELTGEMSQYAGVEGRGSVRGAPVSGEARAALGTRFTLEAKVTPEQARDIQSGRLAAPNPFDPQSMPEGTQVTMRGQSFTSTQMEGTFRHIAAESGLTTLRGVAVSVERLENDRVRVTTGPVGAVENRAFVGLRTGDVQGGLTNQNAIEGAQLRTATIDVSTEAGREAYNRFMNTGQVPASDPARGVSDSGQTQTAKFTSATDLTFGLGPLQHQYQLASTEGERRLTRYDDGRQEQETTYRYPGGRATVVNQSFDAQGREQVDQQTTRLLAGRAPPQDVANLGLAFGSADNAAFTAARQGPARNVEVSLTQAQAMELRDLARADTARNAAGGTPFLQSLARAQTPTDVGTAFARFLAGSTAANDLAQLRMVLDRPLPGTVRIQPAP